MIDGVYKLGVKFMQARETIHIAIELIDRYYLGKSQTLSLDDYKQQLIGPKQVILHQLVCLMVASKLNECDDNITVMIHLIQYIKNQVSRMSSSDKSHLVPNFEEVVECERALLKHFDWNLNFLLPIHFVRIHLAHGILFSYELRPYAEKLPAEDYDLLKQELSLALTSEALNLSDIIAAKGAVFLRKSDPSSIAAAILYFARKNILQSDEVSKLVRVPSLWPQELVFLTRCTTEHIYETLQTPAEEIEGEQEP